MLQLNTPVTKLSMVGYTYAARLKNLGIETIQDLLYHFPFRYEDFSVISKIINLHSGEKVTVLGKINSIGNIYTKHGKMIQKASISDETGETDVIWYNQPFLINLFKKNPFVSLSGEVKWFGHKLILESPDYEIKRAGNDLIHTGRLVPIYPETAGISSKWLRTRIDAILHKFFLQIPEYLPANFLTHFQLIGRKQAIYQIHFPKTNLDAESARKRLSFDEMLILQLAAKIRQNLWQKERVGHKFQITPYKLQLEKFIDNLPFKLTSSQQKAVEETLADLAKIKPMNRLLEGDVGSGKTVVAAVVMYLAFLNGFQSVLMAPTEILAQQHYQTIKKLLKGYHIKTGLITGTNKLADNSYKVIIGTHALISEKVHLANLGLIVIDEQQRFGVEQRAKLREKGVNPHVLILTATPIPRTIALTIYADLDLSVINEMPKGRIPVKTWVVPVEKRMAAYAWIKKRIINSKHKDQVFIICPLIEESESLTTVKAVKKEFERLKNDIFSDLKVGLLHGRLKARQKDNILTDFKKGKINILVSTPVVEVGIDIPLATIMMIEGAERFGLSQLHQLRGRVGRRSKQAFCLLFTEIQSQSVIQRLKLMEKVFSGPKLAEYDLKIRGAGELFGTRQHGQIKFKIADFSDLSLIEDTKKATSLLLSCDPKLLSFPLLQEETKKYTIKPITPD